MFFHSTVKRSPTKEQNELGKSLFKELLYWYCDFQFDLKQARRMQGGGGGGAAAPPILFRRASHALWNTWNAAWNSFLVYFTFCEVDRFRRIVVYMQTYSSNYFKTYSSA